MAAAGTFLFFKKERGIVQSPLSLLPYSVLDSRVLVNLSELNRIFYIFFSIFTLQSDSSRIIISKVIDCLSSSLRDHLLM